MRLRLWHAADGTRVAYREAGAGPALVLLHSCLLTHREWEPVVAHLTHRFRLVLPDLPLHGDSEDRPRHPYTLAWYVEVMSAFCEATACARSRSPSRHSRDFPTASSASWRTRGTSSRTTTP